MNDVQIRRTELKIMQDNVWRTINALELCWACQRISICRQWCLNKAIHWLCADCLS
jgi:hypothetical protein